MCKKILLSVSSNVKSAVIFQAAQQFCVPLLPTKSKFPVQFCLSMSIQIFLNAVPIRIKDKHVYRAQLRGYQILSDLILRQTSGGMNVKGVINL